MLDKLNLKISEGQFVSIFGPNGAGKTTLIRILSTLMRPTSGEFSINDHDWKEEPEAVRASIGMLSHSPMVYDELTPYENLVFYGKMFGLNPNKLDERVRIFLRKVGLIHRMYDRVGTFSRGMKQRLSIARVLIYNPKVLFLDEPYTGLDPQATKLLDSLLIKFNRSGGTVVMTTHNLERGLRLGNRILVLARGNIKLDQPSKKLNIKKLTSKYQQVIEEDD